MVLESSIQRRTKIFDKVGHLKAYVSKTGWAHDQVLGNLRHGFLRIGGTELYRVVFSA